MGNTRSYLKPSMSDAKERGYSKPSKFDAKESDKPSKQQEQQVISTKDLILQKAKPFSDDYPTYDDPIVWGVLTAITKHSIYGRRYQGCQVFTEASVLLTELKSELRTELQSELLIELKAELKSELRTELQAELKTELMVPGFK
ncbi:hypothetical protein HS088_TW11G00266 [Tripterygium wilfordii]|uniref:Uncharacterized protein n=1 Tax=Tripterygium wilfordii TaxID=458696 RepID=A0A7J7D1J6_TRIWF|nr:hypothetical protein HS088_TW11G00266 [Tripterygium wilfordii]